MRYAASISSSTTGRVRSPFSRSCGRMWRWMSAISVPRAEIADIQRHIRPQLLLNGDRTLPVVELLIEAAYRIVRKPRITGSHTTEREVRPLSALTVDRRVPQIAVGDVIAVRVGPRSRRAGGLVQCGVVQRRREVGCKPAQRHLERGPAVAKHVVSGTQPRAEIIGIRRILHGREIARRHE